MAGSSLLPIRTIDGDVRRLLAMIGDVFADFDKDEDADCRAHGVSIDGVRFFVKHCVTPRGVETQTRAIAVHSAVQHSTLVPLLQVIKGWRGPILVYPWVDGVRLRGSGRMAELPVDAVLDAIRALIDVHVAVERAGFVSVDLYDGNLLYTDRIHLIDVDEYQTSPFTLRDDRTRGSTRFMAPEEFRKGSVLDTRTMVYQLGRSAAVLLDPPDGVGLEHAPEFQPVIERATLANPVERYQTVRDLAEAWLDACPRDARTRDR